MVVMNSACTIFGFVEPSNSHDFEEEYPLVSKPLSERKKFKPIARLHKIILLKCTIALTISTRPKMSEVFSRKLVHFDAQLNKKIIFSGKRMIQTFSHITCRSKFRWSNRNQPQHKVAEIEIHWMNQTGKLDNQYLNITMFVMLVANNDDFQGEIFPTDRFRSGIFQLQLEPYLDSNCQFAHQ